MEYTKSEFETLTKYKAIFLKMDLTLKVQEHLRNVITLEKNINNWGLRDLKKLMILIEWQESILDAKFKIVRNG